MTQRLNPQSSLPLYYQMKVSLRRKILEGEYQAGTMLPAVSELMEIYGVGRHVTNRALADLAQEGLVVSRQGVGSFVNKAKLTKQLLVLGGFTASLRSLAPDATTRVHKQEVVAPLPTIRRLLQLEAEEKCVLLTRVGFVNNEPIAVNETYYPMHIGAVLLQENLENASTYAVLKDKLGVIPNRADRVLAVTFASLEQATYLDVREGFPLVCNESTTYDTTHRVFEHSVLSYRSDRVEFAITSYRQAEQEGVYVNAR
jgi:GntR family transcriptional regulator